MHSRGHIIRTIGTCLVLALLVVPAASAQVQVKVNDDTFFKFGLLLQTQADATQDATTRSYSQNVFVRRVRLLVGGQVTKNISFFLETDSPNLGKSLAAGTKNSQPSMYLQDAYAEYRFSDALQLDAGLMLPSPSRNGLQSAASLLPVDYGPYSFAQSAATQSNVGRDTGIQAKGYLAAKHFEYRAGVFQGARDVPNRSLRFVGRVMYNFFDPETGYFYSGTYLGKKKVLAIGGGIDHQNDYDGWAVDAFLDYPLAGGALTTQFDHMVYDGGSFLKNLPKQTDDLLEAGYLIGKTRFMPVAQFARRNFSGSGVDETRYGAGVNYFLSGYNANVKAMYMRIDPDGVRATRQVTVQVQFFYF